MPEIADVPHVWFVPVTGGRGYGAGAMDPFRKVPIEPFNAQWEFSGYPVNQVPPPEASCVNSTGISTFVIGFEGPGPPPPLESRLSQCYGSWKWTSCTDGVNITYGGQLAVGTVFSRRLPLDNLEPHVAWPSWNEVDVWAKYRVDVPARLNAIYLSICDMGANSSTWGNIQPITPANTWRVAYHTNAAWEGWMNENLRVVMSFQGTLAPANVGPVVVDVEWFAIRLRNES